MVAKNLVQPLLPAMVLVSVEFVVLVCLRIVAVLPKIVTVLVPSRDVIVGCPAMVTSSTRQKQEKTTGVLLTLYSRRQKL